MTTRRWWVQLEGIALGYLIVEADSEQDALMAASEAHLPDLVDAYDVVAVSAEPLEPVAP